MGGWKVVGVKKIESKEDLIEAMKKDEDSERKTETEGGS